MQPDLRRKIKNTSPSPVQSHHLIEPPRETSLSLDESGQFPEPIPSRRVLSNPIDRLLCLNSVGIGGVISCLLSFSWLNEKNFRHPLTGVETCRLCGRKIERVYEM